MSQPKEPLPLDDAALEEYLRGNSPLSQQYRALPDDLPPPALDRQVLAQARAALGKQAVVGRPRWVRWGAPMAVAASAVMALSIVMQGGLQEAEVTIPTQMIEEAPAPAAAPQSAAQAPESHAAPEQEVTVLDFGALSQQSPPPFIPRDDLPEQSSAQDRSIPQNDQAARNVESREVAAEKARVQSSPARTQSAQERARTSEMSAEPANATSADAALATQSARRVMPPPPVAAPPPPPSVNSPVAAPSAPASGATSQAAPPPARPMAAPAAAAAPSPSVMSTISAEPETWLSEIRRLRLDGEGAAADREWQRFRKAFPDYAVTDADPARPAQCRGSC